MDVAAQAVIALFSHPDWRARLHLAATAIRDALLAGATPLDLMEAVTQTTAPPAEPPRPHERFLPMSLEAFETTGAALRLFFPAEQISLWLVADEAAVEAVRGFVSTPKQIHRTDWARRELIEAGVPEAEWTIGRLVEVLRARVEEVRHA